MLELGGRKSLHMSDYVKRIRDYIGTSPSLLVGVGAIIYDGKKVLLRKRPDESESVIFGCSLELGENLDEVLKRELKEELGIEPVKYKLYSVFSGNDLNYHHPDGDDVYCVCIVYLCSKYRGLISLDKEELMKVEWLDIEGLLPEANQPLNKALLEELGKIM
jgi:8-oxo-dGTP pyrophosphatase MutT (NUDIX family)